MNSYFRDYGSQLSKALGRSQLSSKLEGLVRDTKPMSRLPTSLALTHSVYLILKHRHIIYTGCDLCFIDTFEHAFSTQKNLQI